MQWHLLIAVLPELVVMSWLKGGICFIPGKAAWHHISGEFGPTQPRTGGLALFHTRKCCCAGPNASPAPSQRRQTCAMWTRRV